MVKAKTLQERMEAAARRKQGKNIAVQITQDQLFPALRTLGSKKLNPARLAKMNSKRNVLAIPGNARPAFKSGFKLTKPMKIMLGSTKRGEDLRRKFIDEAKDVQTVYRNIVMNTMGEKGFNKFMQKPTNRIVGYMPASAQTRISRRKYGLKPEKRARNVSRVILQDDTTRPYYRKYSMKDRRAGQAEEAGRSAGLIR